MSPGEPMTLTASTMLIPAFPSPAGITRKRPPSVCTAAIVKTKARRHVPKLSVYRGQRRSDRGACHGLQSRPFDVIDRRCRGMAGSFRKRRRLMIDSERRLRCEILRKTDVLRTESTGDHCEMRSRTGTEIWQPAAICRAPPRVRVSLELRAFLSFMNINQYVEDLWPNLDRSRSDFYGARRLN